jgi:hypothetical protein
MATPVMAAGPCPAEVRCDGWEVGAKIIEWVQTNRPDARLMVIEGMRGAGKSRALKMLDRLWDGPINTLSLDDLIPEGALDDGDDWADGVIRFGGEQALGALLTKPGLTVIEGPAAWRVLQCVALPEGLQPVRVYIRHMSTSGGVVEWLDIRTVEIVERSVTNPLAVLDRYHRDERPDLSADLIIERLD